MTMHVTEERYVTAVRKNQNYRRSIRQLQRAYTLLHHSMLRTFGRLSAAQEAVRGQDTELNLLRADLKYLYRNLSYLKRRRIGGIQNVRAMREAER